MSVCSDVVLARLLDTAGGSLAVVASSAEVDVIAAVSMGYELDDSLGVSVCSDDVLARLLVTAGGSLAVADIG